MDEKEEKRNSRRRKSIALISPGPSHNRNENLIDTQPRVVFVLRDFALKVEIYL
jgi:hypothetical protein